MSSALSEWVSEYKTFSVAQWLSTGFSRGRARFVILPDDHSRFQEQVLLLSLHVQITRLSFFFHGFYGFFKDYKPEVPSHNSFESQLCETLKNPHAIRKQEGTEFPVLWFVLPLKKVKVFFSSFKKGNGNSQGLIRLSNNLYRRRCTKTKQIMSTSLDSIW